MFIFTWWWFGIIFEHLWLATIGLCTLRWVSFGETRMRKRKKNFYFSFQWNSILFFFAVVVKGRLCFNVIVIVPMHLHSFKTTLFTLFPYLLYLHLMDYEFRFVTSKPKVLLRGPWFSCSGIHFHLVLTVCFTAFHFILLECTKNREPRTETFLLAQIKCIIAVVERLNCIRRSYLGYYPIKTSSKSFGSISFHI